VTIPFGPGKAIPAKACPHTLNLKARQASSSQLARLLLLLSRCALKVLSMMVVASGVR
jgi:hypothetical protein